MIGCLCRFYNGGMSITELEAMPLSVLFQKNDVAETIIARGKK